MYLRTSTVIKLSSQQIIQGKNIVTANRTGTHNSQINFILSNVSGLDFSKYDFETFDKKFQASQGDNQKYLKPFF